MKFFSSRRTIGKSLPLLLVVGISCSFVKNPDGFGTYAHASSASAEVSITITIPENETLTGTAIIILEDITFQDAPSVELARLEVPAVSLMDDQAEVLVPVDLETVDTNATINVAVLIDTDDSGDVSAGDWISDSLVPVINNSRMEASVDVVRIKPL